MDLGTASAQRGRTLTIWTPEDKAFWEREGEAIAKLNLWISVPALFLAFAIWQMWSVVAVTLPSLGFTYSTNQLFWLAAAPALSGATLRIFYSFMVPIFGGRRWTAISTAVLLIPALGIGIAVQDNTTSYPTMLMLALLCGLGGGNFSSSMANISFFFPKERKGSALGVNAGLGNLGVSVVQFMSPLVVTLGVFGIFAGDPQTIVKGGQSVQVWTQNAAFIWVPWIALASLAAWFGMNDLADAKASFSEQATIFRRKHTWLMCFLYLRHFRFVHRLRGGLSAAHQEPVPRRQSAGFCLARSAGRRTDSPFRRLARRQTGRRESDAVEFFRHGLCSDRCPLFLAQIRLSNFGFSMGPGRGQLHRILPHVLAAVPDHRNWQRLDLSHDSGDFSDPEAARGQCR